MIPYILAAVGGYLIGQSRKDQQFADGGGVKDGDSIELLYNIVKKANRKNWEYSWKGIYSVGEGYILYGSDAAAIQLPSFGFKVNLTTEDGTLLTKNDIELRPKELEAREGQIKVLFFADYKNLTHKRDGSSYQPHKRMAVIFSNLYDKDTRPIRTDRYNQFQGMQTVELIVRTQLTQKIASEILSKLFYNPNQNK